MRIGFDPKTEMIVVDNPSDRPLYICQQDYRFKLSDNNVDALCMKAHTYDSYLLIPTILMVHDVIIWRKSS